MESEEARIERLEITSTNYHRPQKKLKSKVTALARDCAQLNLLLMQKKEMDSF